MTRMPAISLAAVPGRRRKIIDLAKAGRLPPLDEPPPN